MVRQCCSCKRVYREGRWEEPHSTAHHDSHVTHGYCEKCHEDFLQSVNEYLQRKKEYGGNAG
jgi:hypothetical protein